MGGRIYDGISERSVLSRGVMSRTLDRIRELVTQREVQISDHGYDELADDDLFVDDILTGLAAAVVVRIIRTTTKVLVCLYFNGMGRISPSTWYGEFPRMRPLQPSW
jgi:hypothetical protein